MIGDDFDHLIPSELGGSDTLNNGVPMHLYVADIVNYTVLIRACRVLNQMVYRQWEVTDLTPCLNTP